MQNETKSQAICSTLAGLALIAFLTGVGFIIVSYLSATFPSISKVSWEEAASVNMYAWPATVTAWFTFWWLNEASYD